ncbi:MAG: LPS assembly lipoprotein LptE [Syntrophobacteraceae bacterium]
MRKILLAVAFFLCSVLLSACGYHFSGEGEGPKPGLRLIAVPVFENKTTEPNIGAILSGAVRREFMQKGPMKVVSVEEAEAVFKGTVTSVSVNAVAHHPTERIASDRVAVENRIYLTIDISCEEKGTGRVLWRDPRFVYYKTYRLNRDPLNPNPLGEFESRSVALDLVAREMAVRIHDRFLSNF